MHKVLVRSLYTLLLAVLLALSYGQTPGKAFAAGEEAELPAAIAPASIPIDVPWGG